MRIVVFEHVGADGIEEGGIKRVGPLSAPDDDRLRPPEERRHTLMAMSIASSRAPPSAQPTKFSKPRTPSRRTSDGTASHPEPATNCVSDFVTCNWSGVTQTSLDRP